MLRMAPKPAGSSTLRATLVIAIAVSGDFQLGFHSEALPQIMASIEFQAQTAAGKLKALMMPTVPIGCHCSFIECCGRSLCSDRP